jgi:hypothetical protein
MHFDLSRAMHAKARQWRKIACSIPGEAAPATGKRDVRVENARIGVWCVHVGVALEDAPDAHGKRTSGRRWYHDESMDAEARTA